MKKATIQISYDAEKLAAIQQYMGKKDAKLQAEMEDVMQKLYEKHVPPAVRDFLETREVAMESKPTAPRRIPRLTVDDSGQS